MTNIECPACGTEDIYLPDEKFIQIECSSCKHVFYYSNGHRVGRFLAFFVKVKNWIRTNWTIVQTRIGDKIISERTIYISRCWKCKTPIRAVVSGTTFNKFIGNHLYGNKKCQKSDCNYFICTKCGACLCDGPYGYKKKVKPSAHKWEEFNKDNTKIK